MWPQRVSRDGHGDCGGGRACEARGGTFDYVAWVGGDVAYGLDAVGGAELKIGAGLGEAFIEEVEIFGGEACVVGDLVAVVSLLDLLPILISIHVH